MLFKHAMNNVVKKCLTKIRMIFFAEMYSDKLTELKWLIIMMDVLRFPLCRRLVLRCPVMRMLLQRWL